MQQAIEFKLDSLEVLRGPGVYMYCVEDKAIYIGASRKVVGRILARNHHRSAELSAATSLIVFPCMTWKEATELESKLIADLRPELNMRNGKYYRAKQIAEQFGTTSQHIVNNYLTKHHA